MKMTRSNNMAGRIAFVVAAAVAAVVSAASFTYTSLVVMRVGDSSHDATVAAAGLALPAYLDEISTSGTLVQSIALSTSLCTLGVGSSSTHWFETEGFPTISGNGLLVSFPCYRVAIGSTIGDTASPLKSLAYVNIAGAVDTTTQSDRPYFASSGTKVGKIAIHNCATNDGIWFWISGAPGYGCSSCWGGYLAVNYGHTGTLSTSGNSFYVMKTTPGSNDARYTFVYQGQLYGSDSSSDSGWNGVFSIGSGLPTSQTSPTLLSGTVSGSPWSFVFESATSLYIGDDSTTYNFRQFTKSGSTWSVALTVQWEATAIYSLTGRNEPDINSFVVYGCTKTTLYRYVVSTGVKSTVTTAAAKTYMRGVAVAPAAASATATQTPSITPSNSWTPSKTTSITASQTVSSSSTSSPSSTGSSSSTLSKGASPSTTATSSTTSSGSTTSSITNTATVSSTTTSTNSVTTSQTQTSTPTTTASQTYTPSITASQTDTPSITGTSSSSSSASASITPSISISRTPTSSVTPSKTGCTIGGISSPAVSCADIYHTCGYSTGVYWIRPAGTPYQARCDYDGYTMVAKVDGSQDTFRYDNSIWFDSTTLYPDPSSIDAHSEVKLQAFNDHPFDTIRVQFQVPGGGTGSPLILNVGSRSSFTSLINSGITGTSAGRSAWIALMPGGAANQGGCNLEAINDVNWNRGTGTNTRTASRLGIWFDNEDCSSSDSGIMIGSDGYQGAPTAGVWVRGNCNCGINGGATGWVYATLHVRGPTPTITSTVTPSYSPTSSLTASITASTSWSSSVSATGSVTASATVTSTTSSSSTATRTKTSTSSLTRTATPTSTVTSTMTSTSSVTRTATSTSTNTRTSSSTATMTSTSSSTATMTSTSSTTASATGLAPVWGRMVEVSSTVCSDVTPGGHVGIAEIVIVTLDTRNIALNATVTASSAYSATPPKLAVDGIVDQAYPPSIASTNFWTASVPYSSTAPQWLRVALPLYISIVQIDIYNRGLDWCGTCNMDPLTGATVAIWLNSPDIDGAPVWIGTIQDNSLLHTFRPGSGEYFRSNTVTSTAAVMPRPYGVLPSISNTPTVDVTSMSTPSVTRSSTVSTSLSSSMLPSPTISSTRTSTGSASLTRTTSNTGSGTSTPSPSATSSASPSDSNSISSSAAASVSTSWTHTRTTSAFPTPTQTRSSTATVSLTLTSTQTSTSTRTRTAAMSSTRTSTTTTTITSTSSSSETMSSSASESGTSSSSPSVTESSSQSSTATPSVSFTSSITASATQSATSTSSLSTSPTGTRSNTRSSTKSLTRSATKTRTRTSSKTATHTPSVTQTQTRTQSTSSTSTHTPTRTRSPTPTSTKIHGTHNSCGHGGPCFLQTPSPTKKAKVP